MPLKRPFGVTLLLWLVLLLTIWGAVRLYTAVQTWNVLIEFKSSLSPLYLAVTGAGWGLAGGVLLWSLFTVKTWSRKAISTSAIIWLLEYWLERGFFYRSPNPNLIFAISLSVCFLGVVLAITRHRSTKIFFMRSEEYEQPNQNPNPE